MADNITLPSGAVWPLCAPHSFPTAIPLPTPPGVCAQCGRVAEHRTFAGVWLCVEHWLDWDVRRGLVRR